ncbi:MAG: T9SS type A sorting domain-containing protein [bacterium]
MKRSLFCLGLLGSVVLAFAQWEPEVLLHRQGDRLGWFYEKVEGLGDWTGDEIDDFAVLSYTSGFDTSVLDIWWGAASLSPDPDTTVCFPDSIACFQLRNTGDITGDGIPDLLTGGAVPGSWRSYICLYRGGRAQIELVQMLRVDATAVAVPGDISGDGIPDMIVGDANWNNSRGRLMVYLGTPTGFVGPVDSLEGTQPSFGLLGSNLTAGADMDADGWGDFSCVFNGYDTTVALFHPRPGDYFGDYDLFHAWWGGFVPQAYQSGLPVLVLPCINPHGYCVYLGGDGLDTIPDAALPIDSLLGGTPTYAGDVNADGLGDWVAGSDRAYGGLGAFMLFLGGPWISNYYQWHGGFNGYWGEGKHMNGLGDVNGDGVDDFAMLCSNDTTGHEGSQLVVFAGNEEWHVAVDDKRPAPVRMPVTIHAYPNPTNSEVRIEVLGMSRGQAVVEVWNILGQRVWQQEVSISTDSANFIWGTRDMAGHSVAAGIYFIQVIQRGISLARHKILVTQ